MCVWGGGWEMPVDTAWKSLSSSQPLRQRACGACLPFPSSLRVCSSWPVPLVAASTYQSMFQEEAVMAWDQAVVVTMFFRVWKLSEGQTRWWWWWEGTQNPSAETQLSHLLAAAWPACPRWPVSHFSPFLPTSWVGTQILSL